MKYRKGIIERRIYTGPNLHSCGSDEYYELINALNEETRDWWIVDSDTRELIVDVLVEADTGGRNNP